MCSEGLIAFSYAHKVMKLEELRDLQGKMDQESKEFKDALLTNMHYLCTFGMHDPLREHVTESIKLIKYGNKDIDVTKGTKNSVNVRMVTGDHMETAMRIAIDAGIITQEERLKDNVVLTGEEFRKKINKLDIEKELERNYEIDY